MKQGSLTRVSVSVALSEIGGVLDRIDPDRSGLDPNTRLAAVKTARQIADRVEALASVLFAEADAAQASVKAAGTPLSSWLSVDARLSKREAAGALGRANRLAEYRQVAQAATAGRIRAGQATAISKVLADLGTQLDSGQREQAATVLVDLASTLDSDELAKTAGKVLAEVAPETADQTLETRLQRQAETAHRQRALRQRALRLWRDAGSVRFDGSLPRVEGEAWIALLDAHQESQRRSIVEERDPLAVPVTPEQRRADALIGMIQTHQVSKQAPSSGGDRPRIVVTLNYNQLRREAAGAGLIADDQPISAGELRRLCCEAGLLPAVLGGSSQVLDIGRETRTIPPAIRAALTLRDRGCAFPSCHTRPAVCEAHHIQPWWKGGPTALANLVLLCHHHHALVEPARYSTRDQWEVRPSANGGLPEFYPPARYDPNRKLIRHNRYTEPVRKGRPPTLEPGRGNLHQRRLPPQPERHAARVHGPARRRRSGTATRPNRVSPTRPTRRGSSIGPTW